MASRARWPVVNLMAGVILAAGSASVWGDGPTPLPEIEVVPAGSPGPKLSAADARTPLPAGVPAAPGGAAPAAPASQPETMPAGEHPASSPRPRNRNQKTEGAVPASKGYKFSFKDAPITDVLQQFSVWRGKPLNGLVGDDAPGGTLTYISDKYLPWDEALTELNTILEKKGVNVAETENQLVVMRPTDLYRQFSNVPVYMSYPDFLQAKLPDSTLAIVFHHFENAEVQDLEENFRGFLPDNALLTTQDRSNRIILGTNARNIRKWFDLVMKFEQKPVASDVRDTVMYPLKHLSAQVAGTIIQQTIVPALTMPRMPRPGQPPQMGLRLSNRVDISRDDRTNTLVVVATSAVQEQVKSLLEKLDVDADKGLKLQTFKLEHVTADEMYDLMMPVLYNEDTSPKPGQMPKRMGQQGMQPSNRIKPNIIVDTRTNTLLVRGSDEEVQRIADFIKDWDKPSESGDIHFYPLNTARAPEVANQLRNLFPGISPPELVISSDDRSNTVLIRAAGDNLRHIEEYIKKVDQGESLPKEYPVTLKYAKPSEVAASLGPALGINTGKQKLVSFIPNDTAGVLVVIASEKDFKARIEPLIQKLDIETGEARELITQKYELSQSEARNVAQVLNQTFQGRHQTAKGDIPLTVNADMHTNSVLVYSNTVGQALAKAIINELDVPRPESAAVKTKSYVLEGLDVNKIADGLRQQMMARRRTDPGETVATITADPNSHQIMVTGNADQIVLIEKLLEDAQKAGQTAKLATKSYDLKVANADQIANALRELIGNQATLAGVNPPTIVADANTNRVMVSATEDMQSLAENIIQQMDSRQKVTQGRTVQIIHLTNGNANSVYWALRQALGDATGRLRGLNVSIAPDQSTGSLILSGQDADIAEVKKFIAEMEVATKAAQPTVTTYRMRTAYADEAAKTLGQLFTDWNRPVRFVPDVYAGVLYISARPDQMAEINTLLDSIDPKVELATSQTAGSRGNSNVYFYPLGKADAVKIAPTIQTLLAHEGTKFNPKVEGYALTNTLIVTCEPDRKAEVEDIIKKFDVPTPTLPSIAIRTLPNGSAMELALALKQAFAGTDQVVNVFPLNMPAGMPPETPHPTPLPASMPARPTTMPAHSFLPGLGERVAALVLAANFAQNEFDMFMNMPPAQPTPASGQSSSSASPIFSITRSEAPISISVDSSTNLMYIRATETQIEEIDKMIDVLLRTGLVMEQRLYSEKLKAADPQQVAQLLNQIYGSAAKRGQAPQPQPQPQVQMQMGGRRGRQMQAPDEGQQAQVIQAQAIPFTAVGDKRTGYLFFRCDPKEAPNVHRLVAELDQVPPAAKEVKWEIIQLKNIDAVEARDTVMVSLGLKQPPDSSLPAGGDANQRLQLEIQKTMLKTRMMEMSGGKLEDENISPADITVSANPSTNSIVLQGPKQLVEYTKKLLTDLDKQEPPPGPVLRNFKLTNADPATAAEVVNTLMRTKQTRPGRKGDPNAIPVTVAPDVRGRQLLVTCLDKDVSAIEEIIQKIDVPADQTGEMDRMAQFKPEIVQVKYVRARDLQDRLKDIVMQLAMQGGEGKSVLKSQVLSVVADDATNRLIITASPAMKTMVKDILLPQLDTKDASPIERKLHWLKMEHAGADDVARQLQTLLVSDRQRAGQPQNSDLQNTPTITSDLSTNSVLVYCAPAQYEEIAKFVKTIDVEGQGGNEIHVVQIRRGRASDLAPQVETLLNTMSRGRGSQAQQVVVRADENTNSLLITGGPRQVKVVEDLVETLDKVRPQGDRNVYIIPTGATDPAVLQQVLQQMINQGRKGQTSPQQPTQQRPSGGGTRQRGSRGPQGLAPAREDTLRLTQLSADILETDENAARRFASGAWRNYALADAREDSQALADLIEQVRPTPTPIPQSKPAPISAPMTPDDRALAAQMQMVTPTPTPAALPEPTAPAERPTVEIGPRNTPANPPAPAAEPGPRETRPRTTKVINPEPPAPSTPPQPSAAPTRFDLNELVGAAEGVHSQKADLARLSGDVEIYATPGGLVVQAGPEDFKILKDVIALLTSETGGQMVIIPLAKLEATEAAGVISRVFAAQGTAAAGQPVVVPDPAGNNLIVRGNVGQIEQIKTLVGQMELSDQKASPTMRMFQIRNAQASIIAGLLQRMFSAQAGGAGQRDGAPVTIVADDRTGSILVTASPKKITVIENLIKELDVEPMTGLGIRAELMMIPVKNADVTTLSQVLQTMVQPFSAATGRGGFQGRPGGFGGGGFGQGGMSADATQLIIRRMKVSNDGKQLPDIDLEKPIRIFADAQTSTIYLASTPENLRVLAELVTMLDTVPLAPGVKVNIRLLEHADAQEAAKMLRDFFDQGRKLGAKPGEVLSGRLSLAKPASLSGEALSKPISIVADTRTNAVILSGQEDSLSLAKLILDEMDKPGLDKTIPITIIPLRFADAAKLAQTLQKVVDQRAARVASGGAGGASAVQAAEKIVIQSDSRSNALIVSASKSNLPLVQELVAKLDVAPPLDGQVKLYTLKYATASKVAAKIKNLFASGLNRTEGPTDNPDIKLMDKLAIESDDRTRTIIASSSRENLLIVDDLIKKLDTQDTAVFTDTETHFFKLKTGDAQAMADRLKQYFNDKLQQMKALRPDAELPFAVFADPRTNTLVVTTNKEVLNEVSRMVDTLEGNKQDTQFKIFKLQFATAQALAPTLQKIFTDRQKRMGTTGTQGGFSIDSDVPSNSIVASMTASDMTELEGIIKLLDVKNDGTTRTEVFFTKNAKSSQIITVLQSLYNARTTGGGGGPGGTAGQTAGTGYTFAQGGTSNSIVVKAPPGEMAGISELIERLDKSVINTPSPFELRLVKLNNGDAVTVVNTLRSILGQSQSGAVQSPRGGASGTDNPATPIKVIGAQGKILQAIREDVTLTPDIRLNAVVIQAPPTSADMVMELVTMLDQVAPPAQIKIFVLKNADATKMFDTLTKLFNLDSSGRPKPVSTGSTDASRNMWFSDAAAVAALASMGGPSMGKEQVAVTLDVRTNSIIASGTPGYLSVLDEVIRDLDVIKTPDRKTEVIPLKNAKAADVVKAVSDYIQQELKVFSAAADMAKTSPEELMARQVSITQMPNSNDVILGADPRRFDTLVKMIGKLDAPPPQVMIQTLIVEVTLDDTTELGMDWGFQNLSFTHNSNGTGKGKGQDVIIGTDLGSAGAPNSLGGFNVTITGQDFSYLLRALQTDGRLEVLSRPQIMVSDNQKGSISIGQSVPFVTNVVLGTAGQAPQSQVQYKDIGIMLNVTPHINPEGWVNMEIAPEISSISQSQTVVISTGVNAQVFNKRAADTFVNVRDGETVVLGGLITTNDSYTENGIPLVKDIPIVGIAFRYTKVEKQKTELLIIMTPRVVRTAEDARRISVEERDNTGLLENVRRSPLMQGLQVKPGAIKVLSATTQPADSSPSGWTPVSSDLAPVEPSAKMRQDVIVGTAPASQPATEPVRASQPVEPGQENWPIIIGKPKAQ